MVGLEDEGVGAPSGNPSSPDPHHHPATLSPTRQSQSRVASRTGQQAVHQGLSLAQPGSQHHRQEEEEEPTCGWPGG